MTSAGDSPLRQALWPLGLAWCAVSAARNGLYDRGVLRARRIAATVVSVGNLSVGGTGKTPTVAWLCEFAKRRGKRPGVLARGYGRAPGAKLNDEGTMLQRRMPWLLQEQAPDRVAGGERLASLRANYIVLDDGFQHRRLHRDLDLVCVDAMRPFGNGMCLPAGELREARFGLRRAGMVFVTRCGAASPGELVERVARLRDLAGKDKPVFLTDHQPVDLVAMPEGVALPLRDLRGRRCVLLSGIARPASFRATVEALGGEVVAEHRHRDHHRFTLDEVAAAARAAIAADAWLLTTEKDDARMPAGAPPRYALRIALQFLDGTPSPAELLL
jgi:tetraacyldisaccharide 4'-kinase